MSLDLLTVFGAGLLTFATPGVLPLVPIYLAALRGEECPGVALLDPRPDDDRPAGLTFPDADKEAIACPSTSIDAMSATRPSRSSDESPSPTTFDVPAVIDPRGSCSQVLP
jgi:hypothetical protein